MLDCLLRAISRNFSRNFSFTRMCGIFVTLHSTYGFEEDTFLIDDVLDKSLYAVKTPLVLCPRSVNRNIDLALARRGPDRAGLWETEIRLGVQLVMQGSVLQMRGTETTGVPVCDQRSANVLLFNGEIFSWHGNELRDGSDSTWLFAQLGTEVTKEGIIQILSSLRGPWCLVYWQSDLKKLWIAKDIIGRRSLLLRAPSEHEKCFVVASVSTSETGWTDIAPGIYSIQIEAEARSKGRCLRVNWENHEWFHPVPRLLDSLKRRRGSEDDRACRELIFKKESATLCIWKNLDSSVRVRTVCSFKPQTFPPNRGVHDALFGVLFSGGLDSVILCSLLHRHVPISQFIDLCSVCFEGGKSPDRRSAKVSLAELERISPGRKWRLIEVNVCASEVVSVMQHVRSLISPSESVMDFNIGVALWFAAKGKGVIHTHPEAKAIMYTSKARILITGHGADELFAGYSRHRSVFQTFGRKATEECLRKDMLRLWHRNLGRDDRIISDHGREARYPYLDEDLILSALAVPDLEIADLDQPKGEGDKKCLRTLARHLGLWETAQRHKRAIQFGSRVSKTQQNINL